MFIKKTTLLHLKILNEYFYYWNLHILYDDNMQYDNNIQYNDAYTNIFHSEGRLYLKLIFILKYGFWENTNTVSSIACNKRRVRFWNLSIHRVKKISFPFAHITFLLNIYQITICYRVSYIVVWKDSLVLFLCLTERLKCKMVISVIEDP